jgi:hypothetical protein
MEGWMAAKQKKKKQAFKKKLTKTTWEKFLSFCNKHAETNWWFRGLSDVEHELVPKVGRGSENERWDGPVEPGRKDTFADLELRIFDAFKRRAVLGLQVRPQNDFEWLAVAQHHGVPTRLLDWTPNPLMAAWFATNKKAGNDGQIAKVIAVRATSQWREHEEAIDPFDKRRKQPVFVVSPHWHARVRAQRGCFSIHPIPNKRWDLDGLKFDEFQIPQAHWRAFQRRLFYFGIDASTTMADLSGLGDALAWQFTARVGVGASGY